MTQREGLARNPDCIACEPGERCRGFCTTADEQTQGSDLYSPMVKRVMAKFTAALKRRSRANGEQPAERGK